jgi:hypothetical protein
MIINPINSVVLLFSILFFHFPFKKMRITSAITMDFILLKSEFYFLFDILLELLKHIWICLRE